MKNECGHRVGLGFDSHAFSKSGMLTLGGLRFKGTPQLKGHSDGDAVLHALVDALLGAASLGDIGLFFPDTSKKYKGVSSQIFLKEVLTRLKKKGCVPLHVDFTLVCGKPRISLVREKMRKTLARLLKISPSEINIKGKTPEGLQWFGPEGGVAVWALATVVRV